MNTNFPEQRYLWRCVVCAFVAPRREDWDDCPGATFCPHDGTPLERVSCPHCDAPVMWVGRNVGPDLTVDKAPWCPYCGGATGVVEKKMRDGPKILPPPESKPPSTAHLYNDMYGDNLLQDPIEWNGDIKREEQDSDEL